jgi:hypothetical protein
VGEVVKELVERRGRDEFGAICGGGALRGSGVWMIRRVSDGDDDSHGSVFSSVGRAGLAARGKLERGCRGSLVVGRRGRSWRTADGQVISSSTRAKAAVFERA